MADLTDILHDLNEYLDIDNLSASEFAALLADHGINISDYSSMELQDAILNLNNIDSVSGLDFLDSDTFDNFLNVGQHLRENLGHQISELTLRNDLTDFQKNDLLIDFVKSNAQTYIETFEPLEIGELEGLIMNSLGDWFGYQEFGSNEQLLKMFNHDLKYLSTKIAKLSHESPNIADNILESSDHTLQDKKIRDLLDSFITILGIKKSKG